MALIAVKRSSRPTGRAAADGDVQPIPVAKSSTAHSPVDFERRS
jgi:hypothetical protein